MSNHSKYALIIGVGGDLPVTSRDARAIQQLLIDPRMANYPPENVFLMTEQQASKDNITNHLKKLIEIAGQQPGSTILVYYSGHGGLVTKDDGSSDYYLFTHGYNSYKPDETMLSGNSFSLMVNKIQSERLLVFLDCCHADGIEDEGKVFVNEKINEARPKSALLTKMPIGKGKAFVSSSKDDQKSLILKDAEHSLFTEVMLEALRGTYNLPEESHVSALDLIYALLKQVPQKARRQNHTQIPVLSGADDLDEEFKVCRNSLYRIEFGETDPMLPIEDIMEVRETSRTEKQRLLDNYEFKMGPDEIIQDIQNLINENVPEELIKDVESLVEVHQGFFQQAWNSFSNFFSRK